MTAMLLKDWYGFWSAYKKNLVATLLIYGVLSVGTDMEFLAVMLPYLMAYYGLSCVSMDDLSHWGVYGRTLPVGIEGNVAAKYAFTLLCGTAGMLSCWGIGAVHWAIRPGSVDWLEDYAASGLACLLTALLMMSLILPQALKSGVEKARMTMLWIAGIFIGLLLLVKFGIGGVFAQVTHSANKALEWANAHPAALLAGLTLAVLLAYGVSYRMSCRICLEKEE